MPKALTVFSSVQFSCSVVSNSFWPHEPQYARPPCPPPTPGSTQAHVHWVSDAFQPSHPLSSPSPPALNLSQHQALFQGVSSSHQVAKILELQLQHQSLKRIFRTDFLIRTGWISMQFKGLSRVFSNTQFKIISSLVLSFLYSPTLTPTHDYWKNHSFD